jgi:ABC-type branched-subunit amino acid transport system substrate-binding protein
VSRKTSILAALAALASILATGVQARPDAGSADPGVTATTLVIGGTVPLSGVAAAYASVGRGADAYFKYVNAKGGVAGRKIDYRFLDDQYLPSNTVQQTRKLVQEDKVFAIYNSLGTEHNIAIRPFLNQLKVPQVFPATGATTFGADQKEFPSTTAGFQPSYIAEGRIYGKAIGQLKKGSTVAVLFQNDDYGKDVLNGLKQGLRFSGRGGKVVAAQSYEIADADVASQIAKLRGSKADVLVVVATPKPAIQTFIAVNKLGWKPKIIVNAVASASNTMKIAELSSTRRTEGTLSIAFIKDPTDPRWTNDAGGKLYRQVFRQYGTGDVSDVYNVYAMASAFTLVEALKKVGTNLTRAGLLKALANLNVTNNPFLLPGVTVRTGPGDPFLIEQARLERWTNGRWVAYGPLLNPKVGR